MHRRFLKCAALPVAGQVPPSPEIEGERDGVAAQLGTRWGLVSPIASLKLPHMLAVPPQCNQHRLHTMSKPATLCLRMLACRAPTPKKALRPPPRR